MPESPLHEIATDVDDLRQDLAYERQELEASIEHDYSTTIVPLDRRRPMWHFTGMSTTFAARSSCSISGCDISVRVPDDGEGRDAPADPTNLQPYRHPNAGKTPNLWN